MYVVLLLMPRDYVAVAADKEVSFEVDDKILGA